MDLMPLADWLGPYLWAGALLLMRLGLVVAFMPGLGQGTTPPRLRLMLLVMVALVLDLSLGGLWVPLPSSLLEVGAVAGREVLLGAGMGLALRFTFAAVEAAGSIAGISMALSHEALLDPASGEQNGTLGWLMGVTAGLIFFTMDGHHIVIRTLHAHLERHPPGQLGYAAPTLEAIAGAAGKLARDAMVLASPAIVVGLVVNAAITLSARLVPSLNVFAVGLGLLTLTGLLSMGMVGDALVRYLEFEIDALPELLFQWGGGIPAAGGR